jgi:hypothetical protein
MNENNTLNWQAYEYKHTPKSADWFWALGIIAISIAVTSILFNNFLFAIFIILGALALGIFAKRRPLLLSIEINDKGIKVGRTFYAFSSIESFWVDAENENDQKVIIKVDSITMSHVAIPIEEIDPMDIKEYLLKYLPEEEHAEPIANKIMERLGF